MAEYWLKQPEPWAIEQERQHHEEALHRFGEIAIFVLLWQIQDLHAGLVTRCSTCYDQYAEAYRQVPKEKCPDCLGTTFDGGFRAKLVRPSLWDASELVDTEHSRSHVRLANSSVQSTSDFLLRKGDFVLRGDGTRWRVQGLAYPRPRTGFQVPLHDVAAVASNFADVVMADEASVAFLIEPTEVNELIAALSTSVAGQHVTPDSVSDLEFISEGVPLILPPIQEPPPPPEPP